MMKEINFLHDQLKEHELYESLTDITAIKTFMKWHIYAVWDFMSLLKSLQKEITCTTLPWKPSKYPKDLVRFINEIVLGEESDIDGRGNYIDHYSMYLKAMKEVGVDTTEIESFTSTLDIEALPLPVAKFVSYNLNLALSGAPHEVAASFFWGRENLIPDIFEPIVNVINSHNIDCPYLKFYLERHIELDGDEHGDLAQKCFMSLTEENSEKIEEGHNSAIISLKLRKELWDFVLSEIRTSSTEASL